MTLSNIILSALKFAIHALESRKIPYCLFGGLALQAYGRVRSTLDVDIILSLEGWKMADFIGSLRREGLKIDPEKGIKKIGDFNFVRFTYTDKDSLIDVSVDFVTARTDFQQEILSRRKNMDILGLNLYLCSCEDLILLKLISERPLDQVDIQVLMEENRQDLDFLYLEKWARALNVYPSLKRLSKRRMQP